MHPWWRNAGDATEKSLGSRSRGCITTLSVPPISIIKRFRTHEPVSFTDETYQKGAAP